MNLLQHRLEGVTGIERPANGIGLNTSTSSIPVNTIREPASLVAACFGRDGLPPSTMFCDTLPVKGDLELATGFEIELFDRRLTCSLRRAYRVDALPLER